MQTLYTTDVSGRYIYVLLSYISEKNRICNKHQILTCLFANNRVFILEKYNMFVQVRIHMDKFRYVQDCRSYVSLSRTLSHASSLTRHSHVRSVTTRSLTARDLSHRT